jgi:hypothetical protein
VLKAARDITTRENDNLVNAENQKKTQKKEKTTSFEALYRYCSLQNLAIEDAKFCYNIDTIKGEINRMMTLGANDERICKKIKSINPDFCLSKISSSSSFSSSPSFTAGGSSNVQNVGDVGVSNDGSSRIRRSGSGGSFVSSSRGSSSSSFSRYSGKKGIIYE